MIATNDERLAGTATEGDVTRLARKPLLLSYNLWAWPYLALNTLVSFAGIRLRGAMCGDVPTVSDSIVPRWAGRNLRAGFFRVEVSGEPPPPGSVIVANHASVFDIAVLFATVPAPTRFVARFEVARVPVVGSILIDGGHVLVDREGGERNGAALDRAAALAREGMRVVFFPEGTRSRDGTIGPFRSGAFRTAARAGVPIVPVVLSGTREAIPALPGPIVPCRVAVRFLSPRRVAEADAGDPVGRRSIRDEMAAALDALATRTGPRL